MSIKTSKTEKQREKTLGRGEGTKYPRTLGQLQNIKKHAHNECQKEKREKERETHTQGLGRRDQEILEAAMTENSPQVRVRHQAINPGNRENQAG